MKYLCNERPKFPIMKKLLLTCSVATAALVAHSQNDTLLWNNFEEDPANYMQIAIPLGNPTDTTWYNFDIDGNPDGSSSSRPGEWFWAQAFSDNDTVGNAGVLASNSWSNSSTPNDNVLITPSIYIGDANATLSWKSAPYQTPRYLDGYRVLIATNDNDLNSFTDTVFVASEYVSLDNQGAPNDFASYTFAPVPTANNMAPFVHGMDGTYTEVDPASVDSSRLLGRLRPLSISLAAYSGMNVYIMFEHYTTDDNLIELDDILVMGTDFTGVAENSGTISFSAYPNPANDQVNLRYNLANASAVTVNVYDVTGKLVMSEAKGNVASGQQTTSVNVSSLPAGVYHVELVTAEGTGNSRVIVQ